MQFLHHNKRFHPTFKNIFPNLSIFIRTFAPKIKEGVTSILQLTYIYRLLKYGKETEKI